MDPKRVIITSDLRTGKDNRYALQIIRDDGMLDNVYTLTGQRAYWNPMPEQKAAAKTRTDKILEKATAKREASVDDPFDRGLDGN